MRPSPRRRYALLCEHVASDKPAVRCAAAMALGLAYAGTRKPDVRELLLPLVDADEAGVEVVAHAVLALGLVFAGTTDGVFRDRAASRVLLQFLLAR